MLDYKRVLLLYGVITGLAGPPLAMFSYYYFNFRANSFEVFIDRLLFSKLFGPVLGLCVLINLLLFFIFIWLGKDEGAKGVLFSTILYAFVVFLLKIF